MSDVFAWASDRRLWSHLSSWISIALAFSAAAAWWYATQVEVEQSMDSREGGVVIMKPDGRLIDAVNTAALQNRWNAIAASLTGGATFAQGISNLLA